MNSQFVVRGKEMRFTSTDPSSYGDEETFDTYEMAKDFADKMKKSFPYEEFEVKEI